MSVEKGFINMNITINFYGDIYADLHDCPCPSFADFEDEEYEDGDFGEYDIENDESESDDCIFGRIKADFSNLDELIESVPIDVAIAVAVKMGMELMKTAHKGGEENAH